MRAFLLLVILLFPASAMAQGSDFPVITPDGALIPSFPGRALAGVPQFGGGSGQGMAPESSILTIRAPRGSKVTIRWTTRWWNLGDVLLGMFSDADQGDMQWTDGRMFRGMCLFSCDFEFTSAGDDTVNVWAEYRGCDYCFGGNIELVQVVPPVKPAFSILPNWSKQTYHNIGWSLAGLGAGFNLVAGYAAYAGDGLTAVIMGTSATLTGFVGGLLIAVDPWDDAYAYPYDPVFKTWDQIGLNYLPTGSGNDFWDTISNDNNLMVQYGIYIDAYLRAANISVNRAMSCAQVGDSCADWQAERARQFFEAANKSAYWEAAAMWQLAYQYRQQGFGSDYQDLWNNTAGQFWQMYNNGVR